LLLLLGVCLAIRMPVIESYIVSHTNEGNRSTILGIYYFTAMESGGVLTPVMGFLCDRLGFRLSFTMAGAALLLVTFICSFWLRGGQGSK
jgi:MFS family permease